MILHRSLPPAIYYLPGGTAEWLYNSKTHATLHVELPNASLQPGESLTDSAGYAVGLHALNWGAWNKNDDFSEPVSSVFTNADNIEVYSSGILLAGRSPITGVCPNISFVEVQAPNAAVVIGQLGGRTHAGQIAAKSIIIHQGTHFIWVKEGEYVSTPTVVVRNW